MVEWQQTWPTEYEFYIFIDSNDHVRCKHSAILNHLYIGVPDKQASEQAIGPKQKFMMEKRMLGRMDMSWYVGCLTAKSVYH